MIHRLYARLFWAQGQAEDALACLQKGLEIARPQVRTHGGP
jgi:hypothetical protein